MGITPSPNSVRRLATDFILIKTLLCCSARQTDPLPLPSPRALLHLNPYTPTSTLTQSIMASSPLLTELIVVREWLHETAPSPSNPEATTGYWKFTKHGVMQTLRTTGRDGGLVKAMDPDAPNREGKTLAPDDVNMEKGLTQALYHFIRAGRLEDAVVLCRKANQPWRASSIRGSLLFEWRAIANEPTEDAMDDDSDVQGWLGNRRRKLWKSTCTRAALNVRASSPQIPI